MAEKKRKAAILEAASYNTWEGKYKRQKVDTARGQERMGRKLKAARLDKQIAERALSTALKQLRTLKQCVRRDLERACTICTNEYSAVRGNRAPQLYVCCRKPICALCALTVIGMKDECPFCRQARPKTIDLL